MLSQESKQLCELFAGVLDYPGSSLPETVNQCLRQLDGSFPDIAERMRAFATLVENGSRGVLEETYAQTFDMAPAMTLYIGYHLFGETPKRNAFLLRLEEAYRSHGFDSGTELADHLCVLLRFFSVAREPEFVIPLLEECVLPVLDKVDGTLHKNKNVYGPVVTSLRLFLRQLSRRLARVGEAA